MINRIIMLLIIFLPALLQSAFSQDIEEKIKSLPDIVSVEKMDNNPFFQEAFVIMLKQPLDHKHPEKGSFMQRIILSHLDLLEPVVLITEGYNANNELGPGYLNELCPMLYANQMFVEHRYFGKSRPDSMDWKYLTVENAAGDHHRIVQLFKKIYTGKWISTGISKGGQATLFYRLFYPDDVAETIAYVAPLNFSVEEKRHDRFIRHKAGTAEEREKVMDFQKEILLRKPTLLPMFEKYCREKNYHFAVQASEIYDYCVLEYSFSFWQWGHQAKEIPDKRASDKEVLYNFVKIIAPDYFDRITGNVVMPFFVQALRELGYYGYNTKPFRRVMQLKNTHGYLRKLMVPPGAVFPYEPQLSIRLKKFLKNEANHILMLYGENDPWSASAAKIGRNSKIQKLVMKEGCHLTRINTLSDQQKKLALELMQKWLN